MEITSQIFTARVMHKRLFPKVNQFTYGIYYLVLSLKQLESDEKRSNLPISRTGLLSFRTRDYGPRDGSSLENWIRDILSKHNLNNITENILLVTMPRVMGYGFNPVSFWLCLGKHNEIRAVLCEVNNTFGETHSYICMNEDQSELHEDTWLKAEKVFHVSPFIEREGSYSFRFSLKENKLGIWINYCDQDNRKQLVTSLIGTLAPLTKTTLRKAFWKHPLVTLKTIFLIHWQALKLFSKGIRYLNKPVQKKEKITKT